MAKSEPNPDKFAQYMGDGVRPPVPKACRCEGPPPGNQAENDDKKYLFSNLLMDTTAEI